MKNEIEKVNREFEDAMSKGEAQRLAAVYTQDGQALPPNGGIVNGHKDLQAFWQGALDMGITGATLESLELDFQGDCAIEIGAFVLKTNADPEFDWGKYIVIWKLENGQWRWHRDIWNSSKPAA